MADVLDWAAKHPDELVQLYVSHCDHDDVEGLPGGSHRQSGSAACAETFDYLEGLVLLLTNYSARMHDLGLCSDLFSLKAA